MPSRREFLLQAAASAVGVSTIHFLAGCEHVEIQPKVKGGAFDFITKKDDWYWQSGHGTSQKEAQSIAPSRSDWSLTIKGPNETVANLSFEDLKALAGSDGPMSYVKTMKCVYSTNKVGVVADTLVSTGVFAGIPLPKVLEEVDAPVDNTSTLRTFGADGFTSNIPVKRATQKGTKPRPAILAYKMNGEPLPVLRGGPVRLVIPEMYGYKNMKWLSRLKLTQNDSKFGGYEVSVFGNSQQAEYIHRNGAIGLVTMCTRPSSDSGVELEGPDVTLRGVTVSGEQRVKDILVAVDGGEPQKADEITTEEVLASDELSNQTLDALREADNFNAENWPPRSVWSVWKKTFKGMSSGSHKAEIWSNDSAGRTNPTESELAKQAPTQALKTQNRLEISFKVK